MDDNFCVLKLEMHWQILIYEIYIINILMLCNNKF